MTIDIIDGFVNCKMKLETFVIETVGSGCCCNECDNDYVTQEHHITEEDLNNMEKLFKE